MPRPTPPCRNACANCIPTNSRSCSRSKPRPAYPALQERLRQLHPYELPELLAVEAASGLPEYLQWLAAESRPVN
ncbi:TPA: divalent cation tolerance protein CutA [Klebsiella pneumoniae]